MSLADLIAPFPWTTYSKKLVASIENPRNSGFFEAGDAANRGMHLAQGGEGSVEDGNRVVLYWLVDPQDGVIADARFQVFGQSALIAAADSACDLLIRKNYDQASRITAELIDKQLRDRSEDPAFPKETLPHLQLVVSAIQDAANQCKDLPCASNYSAPPIPMRTGEAAAGEKGYAGWDDLPHDRKIAVIEEVLDREIRPYIALDAGGVDVVELTPHRELVVTYKGSCTSCYSSVGSTLAYIQQMMRTKVHPEIVVIPDYDTPPTGAPPGFFPNIG